jgi:hypothetical protein
MHNDSQECHCSFEVEISFEIGTCIVALLAAMLGRFCGGPVAAAGCFSLTEWYLGLGSIVTTQDGHRAASCTLKDAIPMGICFQLLAMGCSSSSHRSSARAYQEWPGKQLGRC